MTDIEATFQYALTTDGVSVAYGVAGEGVPLLLLTSPPICHVQLDWESAFRELMLGFAASFHFVWLDWHGTGMSDRETSADFTIDAMLRDVDAVVERVALDRFAVVGQATAVPIAITYAARHPERVTHLVLADGFAEPEDWRSAPWATMATAIQSHDWNLYTETMARVFIGEHAPANREALASFAAYIRACVDQPTMLALSNAFAHYRVSSLLAEIATPTLVLATGHGMVAPEAASQRIAARISGAEYRRIGHTAVDLHAAVVEFVLGKQFSARGLHSTMVAPVATSQSFASGRYAVQRLLGEGGQKTVYLARDTQLERDVALAIFRSDGLDASGLVRLRREARTLAGLGAQPHVVTVFDIGEEDGVTFVVSEFVSGGDLQSELREAGGALTVDRALAITQDLCQALITAHEHGVCHRDIKPANIWLTEKGRAKLGDFGLASAEGASRLTYTGTVLGTAAYMPPEQAITGKVDASGDLYSLGCVLYEMLAGRPPFIGDDMVKVIAQHINNPAGPPSVHNPDVPPALDALVLQLLAKKPQERPQTAVEVQAALAVIDARPRTVERSRQQPLPAPRVQYARTEDGVSIAYCAHGEGTALVLVPPVPLSHVQLEWENFKPIYKDLEDAFRVGWYDHRGCGMSQRDQLDFSMEAMLRDLSAVVDQTESDRVALAGFSMGGPIAIAFASRWPERVSHLLLVDGFAKASDSFESPAMRAERALRGQDWTVYTASLAHAIVGYRSEFADAMTEYILAAVGPETIRIAYPTVEKYDVSDLLPQISVPTLVVWNRTNPLAPMDVGQRVAAGIPRAEFVLIDDLTYHQELASRIREFVLQDATR